MAKKTLSWRTALVLVGLSVSSGTVVSAGNARQVLGVVDWGQYYQTTSDPKLVEGAKLIQSVGARNIFIAMSSNLAGNYPGEDFGPGPISSLKDLAQTPDYQQVFNMAFSTYVIVAYAFSDPDTLGAQNLAAEQQEIADLTAHLLKTYKGTGKKFILKNWEGDWALSEYANHGANDPNYIPSPALLQKMKDWLNARHAGIVQGRTAATQAGPISNVEVHDAAEFVFVRHAQQSLPCFLTAVVPNVQSDYVSYSSYESLAYPTVSLAQGIANDLAFIRTLTPVSGHQRPLIVSEFGFKESDWGSDTGNRTRIAAQAYIDNLVSLAMYWSVEDAASQQTMALVRPDGSHSPQWTVLNAMLSAANNPPSHQVRRHLNRTSSVPSAGAFTLAVENDANGAATHHWRNLGVADTAALALVTGSFVGLRPPSKEPNRDTCRPEDTYRPERGQASWPPTASSHGASSVGAELASALFAEPAFLSRLTAAPRRTPAQDDCMASSPFDTHETRSMSWFPHPSLHWAP